MICDLQKQVAATSASDVFLERVYQRLSGRPKKVGSAVFIAVDFMDARISEPYTENGFKSSETSYRL